MARTCVQSSDPLGDYAGRGGPGWEIVAAHVRIDAEWSYMPTGCAARPPVNTDPYGGGTFARMGASKVGATCSAVMLGACAP
jgi:hypothetical protein